MKKLFICILIVATGLLSCKKSTTDSPAQELNTWSFKVSGTTYQGDLYWDPLLNTLLQGNDTYTFTMLGGEANSDRVFNIVMSLADTTFTAQNYQSGLVGTDHITAFYFTHGVGGAEIFKSSNYDPGPVLSYRIESYNAATREMNLSFNGNVKDENGNLVSLTEGKVRCTIEKM